MGLTIHYSLALSAEHQSDSAGRHLARLHEVATSLSADRVTPLLHFIGAGCGPGHAEGWTDAGELLKIYAGGHLMLPGDRDRYLSVDPEEIHGFIVRVGSHAEPLALGLARYPASMEHEGRTLQTGLSGWRWSASCKTQYASLLGMAHFLRCHRTVIELLETARWLGMRVDIQDEGGYPEHRSEERLIREVTRLHQIIAGFAGHLAEAIEPTGRAVEAPIFSHPAFEHLEMEGREGRA